MTLPDFIKLYEQKLSELPNEKGSKTKAHELAEKEVVKLEGKRLYKHFNSFSAARSIRIEKDSRIKVEVKKKHPSAYRRSMEFTSKYNWLTGYSNS